MNEAPKPLISIVIPFFNEEASLPVIVAEVQELEKSLHTEYAFELLLMDNHSSDRSSDIARDLCRQFPNIRYLRHSRNFGYQANILAGFRNAKGDAAVQLDADGEDDPRLIVGFLAKWREGNKVVYGVRKTREEPRLLSIQRKLFYRLLNSLSEISLPLDAGDFRLLDRDLLDFLRESTERNIYLRGLIAYAGYKQVGIEYRRRPRHRGESKFSWFANLALALDGLTSFSRRPLILITYLGMFFAAISLILGTFYLSLYVFSDIPVQGFTTLVLLQLFFAGVILMCIGITALYIGRIFDEVKGRPPYLLEEMR